MFRSAWRESDRRRSCDKDSWPTLAMTWFFFADIEAECQDDYMKIRIGFNGTFTGLVYSAGTTHTLFNDVMVIIPLGHGNFRQLSDHATHQIKLLTRRATIYPRNRSRFENAEKLHKSPLNYHKRSNKLPQNVH